MFLKIMRLILTKLSHIIYKFLDPVMGLNGVQCTMILSWFKGSVMIVTMHCVSTMLCGAFYEPYVMSSVCHYCVKDG